jgi:hypothetical protein
MKKITLYHKKVPNFMCMVEPPILEDFTNVGEFEYNEAQNVYVNCEIVWAASQNIEDSWRPNTRSTCVGDMMVVTDEAQPFKSQILFVDIFGMASFNPVI